jgi:ribosomal protein S27E
MDEYLSISCPACGGGVEFPAHGIGTVIPCPHCGRRFALFSPEDSPPKVDYNRPPSRFAPERGLPAKEPEEEIEPVRCPKCHSTQVTAHKKGFELKKALTGGILFGEIGLLHGLSDSNKIQITCLNCGHLFLPGAKTKK